MSTTPSPRQIRFNAFDMNCVGHQSPGLWKHPKDQSASYKDLSYWTDLAKTLEKGKFDGIFIADVLGTYDVFGGSNEVPLRTGTQVPVNDPLMLVSAMAAVTENLGFGVTAGTSYEHPYPFARRLATLDHLTKGRVGWNVVTGYLPSAARNMGQEDQLEHDERYNHADEYLEVVYKLLEGSWEEDAVVRDAERGVFTDPAKVHEIKHEGKYFKVPGIAITEPSPQRTPVIFQAGTSSRGMKFAAANAEAVFVTCPTKDMLKATVTKIRDAAEAAGRGRHDVRIYTMQTIITDVDSAAAQAKFEDYKSYADIDGRPRPDLRLDGRGPVHLRPGRRHRRQREVQRHPVLGGDVPAGQRRFGQAVDDPPACRVGGCRRLRPDHRRLADRGRRQAHRVGRGHRRGRVQPGLRHHPRHV